MGSSSGFPIIIGLIVAGAVVLVAFIALIINRKKKKHNRLFRLPMSLLTGGIVIPYRGINSWVEITTWIVWQ